MSTDQTQTTSPAAAEPKLCKKGCGFFGSSAFGDCCSKCFIEMQKKQGIAPASPVCMAVNEPKHPEESTTEQRPEPMEVEEPIVAEPEAAAPVDEEMKPAADEQKKKKKKTSYKNMLKDMMKSTPERDIEQEKEKLRQVTGGGQFQKIDKI